MDDDLRQAVNTRTNTMTTDASVAERSAAGLPLLGLLALATASFLTILTEALPAGLLPQMGADLGVSEALAGQLITVYAVGSLLAAIPLTTATRKWRRRPLLIAAIIGFALANIVTAVIDNFAIVLVARFIGGVAAGLLWALMAPYAIRMAPAHLTGRALAIALAGTPVALSIGIPAGTFLGLTFGWRVAFGAMSLIAILLIGWVLAKVPDFAGEENEAPKTSLGSVFVMPGIRPILFVTLAFVLAHNILYTYIAPLLETLGTGGQADRVLLTFGVVSLASIAIVGATIDRWLRLLAIGSLALFILAAVMLIASSGGPAVVYGSAAIWGLAFGGAGTVFQTAFMKSAGAAANIAGALIVTVWNIGIAVGALSGGMVLQYFGAPMLPISLLVLLIPALAVVVLGRAFNATSASPLHPVAHA
jgi:predicted MFS family arabinose efflux permease